MTKQFGKKLIETTGKSGRTYLYFVEPICSDYTIGIYSPKKNVFGFRPLLNHGWHSRYRTYDGINGLAKAVAYAVEEVDKHLRKQDEVEMHYKEVSG
jgi:hypothetical protein